MKVAYVDTSCLAAIAFGERGAAALTRRLESFDELLSSNLLEAELRSACAREGIAGEPPGLGAISWIVPDRPLTPEIGRVLRAGQVRGADCWHLATALFVAEETTSLSFLTVDKTQQRVARALGFPG